MPSEEVPEITTERAHAPTAAAGPPAWEAVAVEAAAVVVVDAAVVGDGKKDTE
jgi:hypothetical protein